MTEDAGTATEATEGTEAQEEQQAPEWQQAIEQMGEQFSQRFDELPAMIREAQAPQQEPVPEQSPYEYGGVDPEDLYDDQGEVNPEVAQQLLQQVTSEQVQQQVQPLMQKLQEMEIQRGAERLEQEYPELQQPEVAKATLEAADDAAAEIGRPDLGRNPGFVRLVYLAQKAGERAAGEVPADTQPDGLEAAGGAAAPAPQVDPAEAIVNARNRNSFWGA